MGGRNEAGQIRIEQVRPSFCFPCGWILVKDASPLLQSGYYDGLEGVFFPVSSVSTIIPDSML
jgi:hypothetical protein